MLEINNIDVFYGDVQALWKVSLDVKLGEVVALIGSNGAGKSTTLKTVSGLLRPHAGAILFNGSPIHTIAPFRLIEMGIAHCPEARRLFVEMTVEENLDMGSLRGEAKVQREKTKELVFNLFPRLRERRKQPAGTLSGGEQQMVAIGRGLMAKPRLLLLDEPSLGLSPLLVKNIFEIIAEINRQGATILLVEQNVYQSLRIAHRAYVLETGRVVLTGRGEDLLNNEHVRKAFLGM